MAFLERKHILILYARSNKKDTYINNFEGLKLLINWLSPLKPVIEQKVEPVPEIFRTYEMYELSKILECSERYIFNTWKELYHE